MVRALPIETEESERKRGGRVRDCEEVERQERWGWKGWREKGTRMRGGREKGERGWEGILGD
eukprot:746820-Hanusia_phi.AAC.6